MVGGCDKNMPGGMMAMARMNVPAIYVYGGTIKPGKWKGQDLTIVSRVRGGGLVHRRQDVARRTSTASRRTPARASAPAAACTPRTPCSSSFEALGMSLLGSSQMAAPDAEKADSAAESARVLVEAIKKDLKPRDIITRKSIENAIALVMATGGSTNAVLHYLAIAARGRGEVDHRRLRAHAPQGAGAVRPQALGPLRRGRLPSRRRRAAGAEDPARERRCCTASA